MRRFGVAAALITTAVLVFASVETRAQCSMCRTLLATPEGQGVAAALRTGIVILLIAPFGAFAVIAVAVVRSRRRFETRKIPRCSATR